MRRTTVVGAALLLALLAATAAQAGTPEPRAVPEPQIVGGTDAPPGVYPFAAALTRNGAPLCGGTVIDARWVLTAAHCGAARFDSVVVGKTDLDGPGGQTRLVARVVTHPDYDPDLFHNDLALLELFTAVTADPVILAGASNRAQWAPGVAAQIIGWGATNPDGSKPSDRLQHATVPILSDAACASSGSGPVFDLPGAMLCAGPQSGAVDACDGDSGGPLLAAAGSDWIEAGVVSFGSSEMCAQPNRPTVYTEVAAFRAWLARVRTGANRAPVAVDDQITALEDAPTVADLFANDADPADEVLRVDRARVRDGPAGTLTPQLDGTWTYRPVPDFFGGDSFTYDVRNSVSRWSNRATVEITVLPVNDRPSFAAGPDVTVAEDSGPLDQPWATGIIVGPANESGQGRSFEVVANTFRSLFSQGPAISSTGRLTFTPAPDRHGSATVTVRVRDTGGTANGGIDVSTNKQFRITVTPVNDRPVAGVDTVVVPVGGTVDIPVLGNDLDVDGDALTAQIVTQPTHGTVTLLPGVQVIRYVHGSGGPVTDTFTYRARDAATASEPATVTVLVGARDSDGISAAVEDGAPNGGDGDGDGVPDADQSHVASLPNAVDGSYVTIVAPKRASLRNVAALLPPATPPASVGFPVGMFSYDATGLLVAEPATVTMILHGGLVPDTFFKRGPTRNDRSTHYYEFMADGATGPTGATLIGSQVRLLFIDGEDGDADLTHNGVVRDPGGPAVRVNRADQVGLVDPDARWHLRQGDGSVRRILYGNPGDVPLLGDWDCDGIDTPGLYRQSDGFVYLRNSNTTGIADIRFFFGDPSDVPLAGDWDGDGCDTLSLYRPGLQRFFIINDLGANDGGLGAADFDFVFGNPGDRPFAGDVDGDGRDEVGLHRPTTGLVYYRTTLSSGLADRTFIWGDPADVVLTGDWTGDGTDTVGLFRSSDARFYLRHVNQAGNADAVIPLGQGGWRPVAGVFG